MVFVKSQKSFPKLVLHTCAPQKNNFFGFRGFGGEERFMAAKANTLVRNENIKNVLR